MQRNERGKIRIINRNTNKNKNKEKTTTTNKTRKSKHSILNSQLFLFEKLKQWQFSKHGKAFLLEKEKKRNKGRKSWRTQDELDVAERKRRRQKEGDRG